MGGTASAMGRTLMWDIWHFSWLGHEKRFPSSFLPFFSPSFCFSPKVTSTARADVCHQLQTAKNLSACEPVSASFVKQSEDLYLHSHGWLIDP